MKRILLFLSVVFLGFSELLAQNTCTEQLRLVQRRFDDGLLDDIPSLLSDCMNNKNGFTKEEKANAYKLLIQTYLFSEETQKADEVMIQFLNEFPSYKLAANDPKEFINLYNTYRTEAIFKLEVLAGLSFCTPLVTQYYGISPIRPTYQTNTGYAFEVNYIDGLYKNFNYNIGGSFTLSKFNYDTNPLEPSDLTAAFTNMYIGLPIAIRYNYSIGRINLFARGGIEPVYLINSTVDFTRIDVNPAREPITGTEDLIDFHKKFDIRPFIALGTKLNIGSDQLMVSLGYKFCTQNQLILSELYPDISEKDAKYAKYFFLEDDMLLNQVMVSLSYIRPIYKPKKIR